MSQARDERRLRAVKMSGAMLALICSMDNFMGHSEVIEGVPSDAEYVGMWTDGPGDQATLMFAHPSWDPAPEGAMPPVQVVRFRRVV